MILRTYGILLDMHEQLILPIQHIAQYYLRNSSSTINWLLSSSRKALWRWLNPGGPMELTEAREIANSLMLRHGLNSWTFKFNRNKRRLGVCKQDDRRIELSEHYVIRNDRSHVVDTILHEIAHAIVGTEHGHDDVWKAMCIRIGCSPSSCSNTAKMPEGYWQARCPGCFTIFTRHRRPRRLRGRYCVACGPNNGQLVFRDMRVVKTPLKKKPATIQIAASVPARKEETAEPKQLLIKLLFG